MSRTLLAMPFLLATGLLSLAQPPAKSDPPAKGEPPPTHADAGASAYKTVLRSTVWVHSDRGGGRLATGSGSLVDRGRRLVLTNYHVVGDVKKATVYFPDFGSDKKAIPERRHYTSRAGKLGIAGRGDRGRQGGRPRAHPPRPRAGWRPGAQARDDEPRPRADGALDRQPRQERRAVGLHARQGPAGLLEEVEGQARRAQRSTLSRPR